MSVNSVAGLRTLFDDTIPVILPAPAAVFEKRAARLHSLAPGHAIGDYLEAMAALAGAQWIASRAPFIAEERCPDAAFPFDVRANPYGESCGRILEAILSEMQMVPLPEPSYAAISRLNAATPAAMESSARAILSGNIDGIDLAAAPFLAAALQVRWSNLASNARLGAGAEPIQHCPVCKSPPVAGVVLSGRQLRYLCCSLCATQWYVPRVTCTNCGSTANLSYFAVEGAADAAKAEACGQCKSYLKLFYLEKDPQAEVLADDLAALALDIMMADAGYSRSGVNLFFMTQNANIPQ
jgi:FdhE protein